MKQILVALIIILCDVSFGQIKIDQEAYEFYTDTQDGGEIWKHKKSKKFGVYKFVGDDKYEIAVPFEYDELETEAYFMRALVGKKDGQYFILNGTKDVQDKPFEEIIAPEYMGFDQWETPILFVKDDNEYQMFHQEKGLLEQIFSYVKPINNGNYYRIAEVGDDGTVAIFNFHEMRYVHRTGKTTRFEYSDEFNMALGREDLALTYSNDQVGLFGLNEVSGEGIDYLPAEYDEIKVSDISYEFGYVTVIKDGMMNLFSMLERKMILPEFIEVADLDRYEFLGDQTFFYTRDGKNRGVFNEDLSVVIPPIYGDIHLDEDHPELIHVWDKKGKSGGVYKNGKEYIACEYSGIDPLAEYGDGWDVVRVFKKKKQGIIMDNVLAIPCEFAQIHIDYKGEWLAVSKGKKFGLYSSSGDLVLPLEYDAIQLMDGDLGKVAHLTKGDKAWYYSADGKLEEIKSMQP